MLDGPSPRMPSVPPDSLASLVATRRVLITVGAGGVGKTTTAAALGIAAAKRGRRVLVMTIDPARRLAESLRATEQQKAAAGEVSSAMVQIRIAAEHLAGEQQQRSEMAEGVNRTISKLDEELAELTAMSADGQAGPGNGPP